MENETKNGDTGRVVGVPIIAWRQLYDVAAKIRALDPWQWMTLGHLFGVQPYGSREPGFVLFSEQGEPMRRTISVYSGWRAFRNAFANHMAQDRRSPLERAVEESWVRLMFLSSEGLGRSDRLVLKRLGLYPSEANEFPAFCSQKVGYFPDRLSAAEVAWLQAVLYQAYGMALRIEAAPLLTQERLPQTFFVRQQDANGAWHDAWVDEPPVADGSVDVSIDLDLVRRIKGLQQDAMVLQADLVLTPIRAKSPTNFRSEAIYILLLMNRETEVIICCDALQAVEGIEQMWSCVPGVVLRELERLGCIPAEIEVQSERMLNVMRPLTEWLPFKLTRHRRLAVIESVTESLEGLLE